VVGTPVYGAVFNRRLHVDDTVRFNPDLPLLESWDFGHHHPAVLWSQFVRGSWHVLGEVMGHDMFLEEFAPWVLQQRAALFEGVRDVWTCCDPAGSRLDSQGINNTAVAILQQHKVFPRWIDGANSPTYRDAAIQKLAEALGKLQRGQPMVRVHPRCRLFLDGLEAGYIWDDRSIANSVSPNTRRPKKDGKYDHLQNCAEYTWLNFGAAYMSKEQAAQYDRKIERQMNDARKDRDPADKFRVATVGKRGGW
jgi:hypothetical protein